MKKWLLLLLLTVVLARVEHTGTDISDLEPVELVRVTTADTVRIETDTGAAGQGNTLQEAVADLHATASGTVFLDTAQYLLLDKEAYLPELYDLLRPACRVALARGDMDLTEAARYLEAHTPGDTLLTAKADETQLSTLICREGRFCTVIP